jgi:hypothetical protein
MKLLRRNFKPVGAAPTAALFARLGPGFWLVEADCTPPPTHHPGGMMGQFAAECGMAVGLRTATLLQTDLGRLVVENVRGLGCALGPLAGVAVHEILVNAAIHGNLRVPSGPAREWADIVAHRRSIDAALADPMHAARVVTMVLGWNPRQLQAAIMDAGAGEAAAAPGVGGMELHDGGASLPDASLPDASLPDASLPDASLPDASLPDASEFVANSARAAGRGRLIARAARRMDVLRGGCGTRQLLDRVPTERRD